MRLANVDCYLLNPVIMHVAGQELGEIAVGKKATAESTAAIAGYISILVGSILLSWLFFRIQTDIPSRFCLSAVSGTLNSIVSMELQIACTLRDGLADISTISYAVLCSVSSLLPISHPSADSTGAWKPTENCLRISAGTLWSSWPLKQSPGSSLDHSAPLCEVGRRLE